MLFNERLSIIDDEGKVAATTSAGHLPGEDVVHSAIMRDGIGNIAIVLLGMTDVCGCYHAGEHGYLSFERGTVGRGKGIEVFAHDSVPAGFGGFGEGFHLVGSDVFPFYDRASGFTGFHGYHHEVLLQETKGHFVGGILYLLGPEVIVIVVTAKARHADTDGVLCAGDVSVLTLGVVLEAEDKAGEHLGIHLGELDGPDLLDHLTRTGAKATAVAHLKGGLK